MRCHRFHPLVFAAVLATGCAKGETTGRTASLLELLRAEAADLASLWSFDSLLSLSLLIVAVVFVTKAIAFAVRLAWRLGFDADHKLTMWEQLGRIAAVVVAIGLIGNTLADVAPLVFTGAAVLLLAVGGVVAAPHLHAATIGASLTLRRKLRVGDRIEVADQIGIVREIGLTQVEIRRPDGASVVVPNRLLGDNALTIARVRSSVPVAITARLGSPATAADAERARRVGLLCPHRAAGSLVLVEVGQEQNELVLIVQVWSERSARVASEQLSAALTRNLNCSFVAPTGK